jgi:hypothetical protein
MNLVARTSFRYVSAKQIWCGACCRVLNLLTGLSFSSLRLPRRRIGLDEPVVSPDPSDPKLAHLDGLSLSRALLEGVAPGLLKGDKRLPIHNGGG